MLKVIIADDEMRICQLLKSLIDWEKEGFTIVGYASTGYEAANMCMMHKPDLLITDIRMPGLSGMELVQKLHNQMPSVNVVIITGYSQFQYAHQALRYGVVDYLLKPIRVEELCTALNNVKERIYHQATIDEKKNKQLLSSVKSMQTIKENLLMSLVTNNEEINQHTKWNNYLKEMNITFQGDCWRLLEIEIILENLQDNLAAEDYLENKISEIVKEEFRQEKLELVFCRTSKGYFCLFNGLQNSYHDFSIHIQNIRSVLIHILELFNNGTFTIAVSNLYTQFTGLASCVEECKKTIDYKIVAGKNRIVRYKDIPEDCCIFETLLPQSMEIKMKQAIADGNIEMVSDVIMRLTSNINLELKQVDGQMVHQVYSRLIEVFFAAIEKFEIKNYGENYKEQLVFQGKYFYSVISAFSYLNNQFRTILSNVLEKKGEQSTLPIRRAQLYIEEHFAEPIMLQEVAEYVGLAPSYLSSLFKKQVGKSLVDYVTHVRIQKAKQLLMDKTRSISEIIDEVGFSDEKYFIKRFKKVTGLTPSEYRKLFGNG